MYGCYTPLRRCVDFFFNYSIWMTKMININIMINTAYFFSSKMSKHAGFELIMCMNDVFQVLVNDIVSVLRYG